ACWVWACVLPKKRRNKTRTCNWVYLLLQIPHRQLGKNARLAAVQHVEWPLLLLPVCPHVVQESPDLSSSRPLVHHCRTIARGAGAAGLRAMQQPGHAKPGLGI